jgi:hypothetical protein
MKYEKDPLAALLALIPTPTLRALTLKQMLAISGTKRFRAWMAGRRAGKSYAAAIWLLGGKKGEVSAYCSKTLKAAKSILLGVFSELNSRFNLGLEIKAATGTVIEPTGHVIQFYGLHDVSQADLMRGQKFRKVFLDEGGVFTDELLKYCVQSVIQPALLDLQGHLIIAGTPGPVPKGYFYDITGNPGLEPPTPGKWLTHHWTFRDNPHVPEDEILTEVLEGNGWTEDSATFRREYLGIWCEDADAVIYKYQGEQWAKPPADGTTVMAIDFGVVDCTTWSVVRQSYETRPHVFICETIAKSNIDINEIAQITRDLQQKWSVHKTYADEGALGKMIANNLRNQHNLDIEPATKANKRGRIDICRGRLSAKTLHICPEATGLYDEWLTLCWDEKRHEHHPRHSDDITDATLYALNSEEFTAYKAPEEIIIIDPEQEYNDSLRERAMRGKSGGYFV